MAKYVKPTLQTKFHIDFTWWPKQRLALKADLAAHLCPEAQELWAQADEADQNFDWIDPDTGEVFNIDLLWYLIHTTAILCTFVANNNAPLTPAELHEKLQKKTPELILRTIGGRKVYKGIRPVTFG